jgi:hypothetical protein
LRDFEVLARDFAGTKCDRVIDAEIQSLSNWFQVQYSFSTENGFQGGKAIYTLHVWPTADHGAEAVRLELSKPKSKPKNNT